MPISEKTNRRKIPPVLDRVLAAARVAEENRGQDILILDVQKLTKSFDYFLIVSGSSRRQLYAIGDEIQKKLAGEMGDECLSVSGHTEGRWIAIDYGDLIVHLFEPETRKYYALEELWGKGIRVEPPVKPSTEQAVVPKTEI
ncbi:MAG: ribosome silencing factor [Planctomycetaceae bacterium]|jgi:ribosome-associated protein|nr:ribosome silencing factor [Planctomycetaceae bacterium]